MNAAEFGAIELYTRAYAGLNYALRANTSLELYKRRIQATNSGIKKMNTEQTIAPHLFRGMHLKQDHLLTTLKTNDTFIEPAFFSTTLSLYKAKRFATLSLSQPVSIIMHITGHSGANIRDISSEDEQEILFPTNTRWRVLFAYSKHHEASGLVPETPYVEGEPWAAPPKMITKTFTATTQYLTLEEIQVQKSRRHSSGDLRTQRKAPERPRKTSLNSRLS